ncbi:hypothetical protein [Sphingomonas sp. BAUL-RG-20F-R05-02]|uniref:hypothetical protein n=1 Tax=Sphingomonas sp. BAUL-RG-20F-R05-02 TaxID=2914830 RepID=UPI001F56684A|nr:hypothetical protein [Sphingomonas sp. BAUL-RG-20F-R05-02]
MIHRMMEGTPQAARLSGSGRELKPPPRPGTVVVNPSTGLPHRIEWRREDGSLAYEQAFAFLADAPAFAIPVATFVAGLFNTEHSGKTPKNSAKTLRRGLFAFLALPENGALTPASFGYGDMIRFIDFLRVQPGGESHKSVSYWFAVRCLTGLPGFTAECPANPFSSAKAGETDVLIGSDLHRVLSAAADDILVHKARFDARRDASHSLWSDPDAARILTLMAQIRARFPDGPEGDGIRRLPLRGEMRILAPDLADACAAIGYPTLQEWWGPGYRNLGSSLVLLIYFFRLNLALARDMNWGQFDTIGVETITSKKKDRAGGVRQLPGYLNGTEPVNPGMLRSFLRDWTSDLRLCAGKEARRVFIMWLGLPSASGPFICHLGSKNAPERLLGNFEKKYGLPHFTAASIRPTTIELVDRVSEGSQALAPAVGRHSRKVRRRNYTTQESVWRDLLRLAMAMPVRARDMRARFAARTLGQVGGNHQAATPGWNCSQPYYRGFSTAPEGEMCDAIGRCPACRFGRPDLDCVRSYASTLALLDAVRAENVKGREVEWIGVFRVIESEIVNRWLPSFDKAVRDTPTADLPRVPSLRGALRWPTF